MTRGDSEPTIAVFAPSRSAARVSSEAVRRAGATAWVVGPGPTAVGRDVLSRADGLVVTGDEAIDARASGEGPPPGKKPRQAGEQGTAAYALALIRAAMAADTPVLGVGDGMRVMNVAAGGAPGRSVDGHGPAEEGATPPSSFHRIFISPGSRLAAIVGSGGFVRVNSRHHLGIREAQKSPLLMASAYSLEDGVIEALESPNHAFAIAVQFSPEIRAELPPHFERLFHSLVEHASELSGDSQVTKNTSL